jgi:hypothetical protein
MNSKDKIKKIIFNKFGNKLENDKLDLTAKENLDPFLFDLKKEISMTFEKKIDNYNNFENDKNVNNSITEKKNEDVEMIGKEKLKIIELKIIQILTKINLNFYKNKSDELLNLIMLDFIKINQDLIIDNDNVKLQVENYIKKIVNNEFKKYMQQNDIKKKEMAVELLNKIIPDVNDFFITNTHEKLETMSLYQKNNMVKYFLDSLYKKYLKNDKRLNNDEYHYLKQCIKSFFLNKYNKILSLDKNNE